MFDAFAGKVRGVGGADALSGEDAQTERAGAGFFEGLYLAEANHGRELVAFADGGVSGGGPGAHGAGDDVGGDLGEILAGEREVAMKG